MNPQRSQPNQILKAMDLLSLYHAVLESSPFLIRPEEVNLLSKRIKRLKSYRNTLARIPYYILALRAMLLIGAAIITNLNLHMLLRETGCSIILVCATQGIVSFCILSAWNQLPSQTVCLYELLHLRVTHEISMYPRVFKPYVEALLVKRKTQPQNLTVSHSVELSTDLDLL